MKEKRVGKAITDALFELLAVKPLADITATELIGKAGVCRSSYYRNFYLLEDVIRQYGQALFAEISRLPQITMEDPREHMRQAYACYLEERERLTLLDRRGLLYLLDDELYAYCVSQMRSLNSFRGPYQADFYAGASASMIRSWIHSGFRESPEEMAEIAASFIRWE